ncbi:replicative DNA helicase [uncultured Limosilactobacillus sp.]|uniref:replicative DNA helicase n=1 Tax=uncultured Limosilactobacillus sp. TaxID=2837629 RepID=UPI0025DCC242|nr:replicative DNA helicase [uncultured Limosilactobacillus sp.]
MDNAPTMQQLPHDTEAEKAVLGAIFLSKEAFVTVDAIIDAEDFYVRSHQLIYHAMVEINDRGEQRIDAVTMRDELNRENELANAGGVQYIAELAGSVPTAANVENYAKIVHDKAIIRRLIDVSQSIIDKSYAGNTAVDDLVDDAEQQVMNISAGGSNNGFHKIEDVLEESFNNIMALSKNETKVPGLATGYRYLDQITTGLHAGELVIIAARPAMGKTAFALNIAQNVAVRVANSTVAIFSLEMSAESLVNRMICAEGSIDAQHLRTGKLSKDETKSLFSSMDTLSRANIFIDDTAGIKISEIRAKSRRLAERSGLSLIIVDYLQLIDGGGSAENRQQEVSMISRSLKKLAKELNVPVIALSQLSRGVEQRQDKRPMMSDLRESGSIEQDADIVSFLYRDDYYEREESNDEDDGPVEGDDQPSTSEMEVIIDKNRSGPRGTVKLLFNKSCNKFMGIDYGRSQEEEQ